jgi:hypothetical protein
MKMDELTKTAETHRIIMENKLCSNAAGTFGGEEAISNCNGNRAWKVSVKWEGVTFPSTYVCESCLKYVKKEMSFKHKRYKFTFEKMEEKS